jgi:hypothetical protein
MREGSSFRRAAAFFCLAVVLLAALIPSAASLPLVILVTLSFLNCDCDICSAAPR